MMDPIQKIQKELKRKDKPMKIKGMHQLLKELLKKPLEIKLILELLKKQEIRLKM